MRLVAVGGGIIQDITSFTASVLYRGINWVFMPTTLLAQADSCVGSKTSINFDGTKNLLGGFHPPKEIYCFLDFLKTLSPDDIKSGIGEILHYYVVANSGKLEALMNNYEDVIVNRDSLQDYIVESLIIKKEMVQKDEFDLNERRVFNYGHTFGHAIEVMSGFGVSHGQAVTLGMDMANFVAYYIGRITKNKLEELRSSIYKNIPNYKIQPDQVDNFIELLKKDKKSVKGAIVCILPNQDLGASVVQIDDAGMLKKAIVEFIKRQKGKENV